MTNQNKLTQQIFKIIILHIKNNKLNQQQINSLINQSNRFFNFFK